MKDWQPKKSGWGILALAVVAGLWWGKPTLFRFLPHSGKAGTPGGEILIATDDLFPSALQKQNLFHQEGTLRYKTEQRFASYRPVFKTCRFPHAEKLVPRIILREFQLVRDPREFVLVVDPDTLRTTVSIKPKGIEYLDATPAQLSRTVYGKLLNTPFVAETGLQNAGLSHCTNPATPDPVLSIDLCPSLHPFDRSLFQKLIDVGKPNRRPTPVVVCVSGLWIRKHPADLRWLHEADEKRELAIVWVNHSYTHPFEKNEPWNHNFLLSPKVNFADEVMHTEQAMIEQGIAPSVFFRFPGLISNETQVQALKGWGLIPLGSDAWLGKGQNPKAGSIILVHGNGNEPLGVRRLEHLLATNHTEFSSLFNGVRGATLPQK